MTSDEIFWDRLAGMPYVEAIAEIESRRAELVKERADAEPTRGTKRWDGNRDHQRAAQLSKLGIELRRINTARNCIAWKDAVIAIYGREGFHACIEWIAQRDPLSTGQ